jgi:hypothetical protein
MQAATSNRVDKNCKRNIRELENISFCIIAFQPTHIKNLIQNPDGNLLFFEMMSVIKEKISFLSSFSSLPV